MVNILKENKRFCDLILLLIHLPMEKFFFPCKFKIHEYFFNLYLNENFKVFSFNLKLLFHLGENLFSFGVTYVLFVKKKLIVQIMIIFIIHQEK
jgi:hypothetical protein